MSQIQKFSPQIINDDCLNSILSYIPPIPFFFTTFPLINKQLFTNFFNFVTTCPTEELNYFREINFWDFGSSLEKRRKKEHLDILKNHYRLLFGEKNNKFFNILHQRILQTTETIFLPWWADIAEHLDISRLSTQFKNLKTLVIPPVYQEYNKESQTKKISWPGQEPLKTGSSHEKIFIHQSFIFFNWNISTIQNFFGKFFNSIGESQDDPSKKIPLIEKIVLVGGINENGTAATEGTRKMFKKANFFFKTEDECLSILEKESQKNQKDGRKISKIDTLKKFREYSGFKTQALTHVDHPDVNLYDFSIKSKKDHRKIALLDYFGIKKSQIPNAAFFPFQSGKVDKLAMLLCEYFLDGWSSAARFKINGDEIAPKKLFFGEIFRIFKEKWSISDVWTKLELTGQKDAKHQSIILHDYTDFMDNCGLNVAKYISGSYPERLVKIVKSMHWDILRISFLKKNLELLIENSRGIGDKATIAKRTLKDLKNTWKTCFSIRNFREWMMKFDHVMIFKLWHKLDTDLVRKVFGNTELHYLIPFLLDSGEPDDDSPNFAGILNTPSSKTGELPIDILITKDPYYAFAIANGKLDPTAALSEIMEQKNMCFRVKKVENSNQIDGKYIIRKKIQSGQMENIPFDLIHGGMEPFAIQDISMPLEKQIPPQIYELSQISAASDQLETFSSFTDLEEKLDSCWDSVDNSNVFYSHFNELESKSIALTSIFETMFQNLMKSAHILKNMFDGQKKKKSGIRHSISTLLDSIVNEKLDLFPQRPKKQKVSFEEFCIDAPHENVFNQRKIPSSDYVQEKFMNIVKIAVGPFRTIEQYEDESEGIYQNLFFDTESFFEKLISLAFEIQEKQADGTSNGYQSELLESLVSMQRFFTSDERREFYSKNMNDFSRRNFSQILNNSEIPKLHNQFLKKISETRQNLGKILHEDQKQGFSTCLLKILKITYDLQYYQFQMAELAFESGDKRLWMIHNDWELSLAQFFSSNTEKSNSNIEPFQFEEEQNQKTDRSLSWCEILLPSETQDQEKKCLDDKNESAFGNFFRKYSENLPEFEEKKEGITLLLKPFHKISSQQEIQKDNNSETRMNSYILRSIILDHINFDFRVFEKFPKMKFSGDEIVVLQNSLREATSSFNFFKLWKQATHRFDRSPEDEKLENFICRMTQQIKKIMEDTNPNQDSKKRKRESEDNEEQETNGNSPKKRKLEKNDEKED